MYTTKKLSAIPYGQATVKCYDDGSYTLISYNTPVAVIDEDGWFHIRGLYSMTTRKHISAFVKEYVNISYQTAKMLYEENYEYNIHTGEIELMS